MTPTQRKAMEQALEALELTDNEAVYGLYRDERRQVNDAITALRAALAEQPAEQEPVKFLANGTRFKMSFFQNEDGEGNTVPGTHVTCFEAFEEDLDGRWVALVPAEDDCHLKYTAPQPAIPLGYKLVPVEPTPEMVLGAARELCKIYAGECQVDEDHTWVAFSEQFKRDARDALVAALEVAAPQPSAEPVAMPSSVRKAAYDQIDRFLRNNLHDDDYADYSAALDSLYTAPQPAKPAELSLKRYEPEIWREDRIRMELDSEGDWVRYADVLELIAPQSAIPPGYKLVPVEPSPKMKAVPTWSYSAFRTASEIWADMLAAAPEAPQQEGETK